MTEKIVCKIAPNHYLHVLDNNTNVSRLEIGPQVLIRKDHEQILQKFPLRMIVIPHAQYCVIANPVMRNAVTGEIVTDQFGQAKLHIGDRDFRFEQDPFPLYPGENAETKPILMKVISKNRALHLEAEVDFTDENGEMRLAGSQWYFMGPGIYKPRKEIKEYKIVKPIRINNNTAAIVKALRDCIDKYGNKRVNGETWLIREFGDYLPSVDEEVVKLIQGNILNKDVAIHVKSLINHSDEFGIQRNAGDEWLVSHENVCCYIPEVSEQITREIKPVVLRSGNYCTILNPVDRKGKCQIGTKKVIRGPKSFFLHPGEKLYKEVVNINDGLVLKCIEPMKDRKVGEMWLIRGPCEFVPSEAIEIVHVRKSISMAEKEGIYVKNINTGIVRSVIGGNYMLTEEEELWNKILPTEVIDLLFDRALTKVEGRDHARLDYGRTYDVVSYRIPHNAACQVYDYKLQKARIVFGPELVLLEPDEQFTLLNLSGGVPKKQNSRKALCLLLGPDYLEDMFTVETADHARLSLRVSINWHFELEGKTDEEKKRIFALPDFIGDLCKVVSSRIRGAISSIPFDHFHKNSASIIHKAVFMTEYNCSAESSITFSQNFLKITSLDILSLEPIDQKTRDALQRTVQLAIEITASAQEATARQEAIRLKQKAEGWQVCQKLIDEIAAEGERNKLIRHRMHNVEIEACGQAIADAKSQAEATHIEREAAVEQAKLEVQALKIKTNQKVEKMKEMKLLDLEYTKEKNQLELDRLEKYAQIEVNKFQSQVASIGKETIVAMASAGPELKVEMLQALGLRSALITDGSNPVNLFNTASGLIECKDMPIFFVTTGK